LGTNGFRMKCQQHDGGKDRKGDFIMKKRLFSLGMGAIALLFGLVLMGCDSSPNCPNEGRCYVRVEGGQVQVRNTCNRRDDGRLVCRVHHVNLTQGTITCDC